MRRASVASSARLVRNASIPTSIYSVGGGLWRKDCVCKEALRGNACGRRKRRASPRHGVSSRCVCVCVDGEVGVVPGAHRGSALVLT